MKLLIDGKWHSDAGGVPRSTFRRLEAVERLAEDPEGAPLRYHLFVSYACPYAHRVILARALLGLEDFVPMTVLSPVWRDEGWTIPVGSTSVPVELTGVRALHELYARTDPAFTGRVTVPVLWDRTRGTIAARESADLVRMLDQAARTWNPDALELYPAHLRGSIDAVASWLDPRLCDGVYAAGFAGSQHAYEEAARGVAATLDRVHELLRDGRRFLLGDEPTEVDIKLFASLVRHDQVYRPLMKCTLRRVADMPAFVDYLERWLAFPKVADTVRFDHIKHHYFDAHDDYNHALVPLGAPPRPFRFRIPGESS